jgi:hypothetical protein
MGKIRGEFRITKFSLHRGQGRDFIKVKNKIEYCEATKRKVKRGHQVRKGGLPELALDKGMVRKEAQLEGTKEAVRMRKRGTWMGVFEVYQCSGNKSKSR